MAGSNRNVGLGFVLSAVDKASKVIGGFGRATASSMKVIGAGVVVANQGLNLFRKGWRLLQATIGEVLQTALEFQTQAVRDEVKEFSNDVQVLKARIGDALLPVVLGFKDALGPLVEGMTEWLTVNNKLVSVKVAEWALDAGRIIGNTLVEAVRFLSYGFTFTRVVVEGLKGSFNLFTTLALAGLRMLLDASASAAEALGAKGMGASLREAASAVRGVENVFGGMAAENENAIEEMLERQDAFNAKLDQAKTFWNNVTLAAKDYVATRIANFVVGGTVALKDQNAALKDQEKLEKDLARQREEALKKQQDAIRQNAQLADQMGHAFGQALGDYVTGAKSAEDATRAFGLSVLQTTRQVVMGYAVEAAVGALKANAGLGPFGWIIGAAAAAAAFGVAESYMSKMHSGGIVRSRDGKRDVPVMLADGEEVLAESDPRHRRNRGSAGGGRASVVLQVNMANVVPDSEADFDRKTNRLVDAVQRALESGRLRVPQAAVVT